MLSCETIQTFSRNKFHKTATLASKVSQHCLEVKGVLLHTSEARNSSWSASWVVCCIQCTCTKMVWHNHITCWQVGVALWWSPQRWWKWSAKATVNTTSTIFTTALDPDPPERESKMLGKNFHCNVCVIEDWKSETAICFWMHGSQSDVFENSSVIFIIFRPYGWKQSGLDELPSVVISVVVWFWVLLVILDHVCVRQMTKKHSWVPQYNSA